MMKSISLLGRNKKNPRNWLNALRNSSFKTTLVAFLIRYWANDHLHTFISQKKLYVTCENDCYLFTANNNCVQTTNCANLYSTLQEVNSKMLSHIAFIPSPANIVIRSVDTDVLVIALACLSTIDPRKKVWMETGLESKNSLSYIKSIKLLVSKYAEDYLHYMLLQALTTQVVLVEKGRWCDR